MRFFTTIKPAGRLEFLLVAIAVWVGTYLAFDLILEFEALIDTSVDAGAFDEDNVVLNTSRVPLFVLAIVLLTFVSVINMGRRLKDLDKSFGYAILGFIPIISLIFTLYLLLATPVKDTFTPYGKNPYDPNSWIPPQESTGSTGIAVEGQDIYLPGEDQQAA